MKELERTLPRHPDIALLQSSPVHSGPIFDVLHERIRLPSGLEQELDVVAHGGAVCIQAVSLDRVATIARMLRHLELDLDAVLGRLREDR